MRDKVVKHGEVSPKKKGLLGKIITAILAASIILLLSLLFIAQYSLTESIKVSLGEQIKETAASSAYSIDAAILQQINDIKMITSSPTVINFVINANHRYSQKLTISNEIEEASQKWLQAQGTSVIDSDLATNSTAKYLKDYIKVKDEENQAASLFITDLRGALISTINEAPKYFHGDDLWWRSAYNDGKAKVYISDIYYDDLIKDYLIDVALSIRDGDLTIGILKKTQVASKYFGRLMPRIKTGKKGHAMLIDSRGKVIFCPILEIGSNISDVRLISSFVSPNPAWANVANDAHGGKNSIIGSAPLEMTNSFLGEISPDMRWYTFIWQDPTQANSIAGRPQLWMLIYGLIATGIILAIGYLAVRRIVSPLKRLVKDADIIGDGHLDHYIDINTNDEIGELAGRFNQMAMNLKSRTVSLKEIEKKLIDHSEELKKKESEWAKHQMINTEKIISIEKFAEGIAHEINNHLGIIFGFIQVMLKDCDHGCHSYEEVKIIEKHINYTKKIMDDLLDFAKISKLEKEEVDINKNIEGAVLLLEQKLLLENISLNLDLASSLPKLLCDPKKLQHVYMSLLAKQADTMKDGGTLTISTLYDKDKRSVEIRFKDTGTGISNDEIEKVFNPFYRSKGEGKGQGDGIGLSLSASYGIIKEHQGEIFVESKKGEGTIFRILLPINQEDLIVPSEPYLKGVRN